MKSPKELAQIAKENKARIEKETIELNKKKALEAKKKHDELLKEAEKIYFKHIESGIEYAAKSGKDDYDFRTKYIDYKYYELKEELILSIKKHFAIYKPKNSYIYYTDSNYETGDSWEVREDTIKFSWSED